MTKVDLPSVQALVNAAKLANNNGSIPQAVKGNGNLSNAYNPATKEMVLGAGETLTLPGGTAGNPMIYYLSSSTLNGNSTLKITGHVVIFTDGSLKWNGGTVINNGGTGTPEQFMIFSSGNLSTEISINGGAGFSGAIYAPQANVKLTGGGHVYGAVVGGKINIIGNGQFHYDESLGSVGLIAFFEINEWIEKPQPLTLPGA